MERRRFLGVLTAVSVGVALDSSFSRHALGQNTAQASANSRASRAIGEDRMINPKTQRFMAERMSAKVHSQPVDHTPMYADPNVVVDIILEAAHETLA